MNNDPHWCEYFGIMIWPIQCNDCEVWGCNYNPYNERMIPGIIESGAV